MLELVVGQLLRFREVAFRDELDVGLAPIVAGQTLVDHLPALGAAVLERRERMPETGRTRAIAAEGSEVLTPVGVSHAEAVPRGLREHVPGDAVVGVLATEVLGRGTGSDLRHQPEASVKADHTARLQLLHARVRKHAPQAGLALHDDVVRVRHD
jgi:hypothetical protein